MRRLTCLLVSLAAGLSLAGLFSPARPAVAGRARPCRPSTAFVALTGAGGATAAGVRRARRRRLETAARTTSRYETLGVTWDPAGSAPVVQVRTRTAGVWSGWQELHRSEGAEGNPGREGGTAVRGGTDPMWVGPSDGVQVRVDRGRRPGAAVRPARRAHRPRPVAVRRPSPARRATAGVRPAVAGRPAIVTRASWGADERRVKEAAIVMPTVSAGVLHHTAGKNGYSRAQVPGIIRGDFAYHLSRGWNDIGYNVLVDRFGRAWEGRGGGLDKAILGAHTGGFNTETFGVSVLGNLDVARPSAATVEAIARVMAWKLDAHHRDPLGSTRPHRPRRRRDDVPLQGRRAGPEADDPRPPQRGPDGVPGPVPVPLPPGDPPPRRGDHEGRAAGAAALGGRAGLPRRRRDRVRRVARRPELAAAGARGVLRPPRGVGGRALEGADAVLRRLVGPGRRRGVGAAGPVRPRAHGVLEGRPRAVVHAVRAGRAAGPARRSRPARWPPGPAPTCRSCRSRCSTPGAGRRRSGPTGRVDLRVLGRGGIPASGVTSVVVEAVSVCATRNTALTRVPDRARGVGHADACTCRRRSRARRPPSSRSVPAAGSACATTSA